MRVDSETTSDLVYRMNCHPSALRARSGFILSILHEMDQHWPNESIKHEAALSLIEKWRFRDLWFDCGEAAAVECLDPGIYNDAASNYIFWKTRVDLFAESLVDGGLIELNHTQDISDFYRKNRTNATKMISNYLDARSAYKAATQPGKGRGGDVQQLTKLQEDYRDASMILPPIILLALAEELPE